MHRKGRLITMLALSASLVMGMGSFAGAAFAKEASSPGNGTSWTVPTTPMTNTVVKDGKTYKVLTTWASMWATNGPDYLGISNSCNLTNTSNSGVNTNDLAKAQTSTMLGLWASDANESPNAYNWNMFYNMYEDANALTNKAELTVAGIAWDPTSGTMGPFKYRPEIIWNNSRLSATTSANEQSAMGAKQQVDLINKGQFYSEFTGKKNGDSFVKDASSGVVEADPDGTTAISDNSAYVLWGDSTYNPEYVSGAFMNSFTFTDSFYRLAAAAEKVINDTKAYPGTASDTSWKDMAKLPRASRYNESPTKCALNFEKLTRGSLYYVLSKINDGTTKMKKVAFVTTSPDPASSTVTVIAHDFVGETAGRAAAGNDGGYPNIAPIVVDQLTTSAKIESGGAGIVGNSDNVDAGGNSVTLDLPWTTYTATADELAQCDYVWCVNGSMNKTQLQQWVVDKCTEQANKTRAQNEVDYVGIAPAGIYIGGYTAEKALVGLYNVNYFYPELFPNMELCAFWYDNIYHLKTKTVPTAMSWAFGNADLPKGVDLSKLGTDYSVDDMNKKFAEGYAYYDKAKNTDQVLSRITSGKSLDGKTQYKFDYFEPTQEFANFAAEELAKYPAQTVDPGKTETPAVKAPAKVKKVTGINVAKKKMTVKWGKVAKAKGYQIAYRVKGTSKWKTATATSTSKVIKSLKTGSKYQVKVRAYVLDGKTKVYGSYSPVKVSGKIK